MDYEEILEKEGVTSLNDAITCSRIRKISLEKIECETCGPRMPGDTKVIRESDSTHCGQVKWGELLLCSEHFEALSNKMLNTIQWKW